MKHVDPKKRTKRISEKTGQRKNAVNIDLYDIDKFHILKNSSPGLLKKLKAGLGEYGPFKELVEDLFALLYRYAPELCKDWEMQGSYLLNKALDEKVQESGEYKKLRASTRLDELSSMIGTEVLADKLEELLKELKEQKKAAEEYAKAQQAMKDAQGEGKGEGEGDGEGTPGKAQQEFTLEQAKRALEEARKTFDNSLKKPEFRTGVDRAMNDAMQSVKEITDTIRNWGLEESSSYTNTSYQEKLALINRINQGKLKQIAKLAGRFKRMAMSTQNEKVKKGINETFSVTQGKQFERLISTERARMSSTNRNIRNKFWADWTEGKSLIYELRGKEKKCQGPIVACIDNSGSMSGQGEIWAKAVALGLLEIATYQKRSMYVVQFSAQYRTENLKVHEFPKGKPYDIQDVLAMAEYFEGGGTMFETPLQKSREIIDEYLDFKKADIIFITDGEAPVGNDWLKDFLIWKKDRKVAVFSILVDTGWATISTLKEFSDRIEKVSDLKDGNSNDEIAIDVFRHI